METLTQAVINENGLNQIRAALEAHTKGKLYITDDMLHAYAGDAEDSHRAGNGVTFEIRQFSTKTGNPVEITITEDGYDMVPYTLD